MEVNILQLQAILILIGWQVGMAMSYLLDKPYRDEDTIIFTAIFCVLWSAGSLAKTLKLPTF